MLLLAGQLSLLTAAVLLEFGLASVKAIHQQSTAPIFYGNADIFRPLQTTRFSPGRSPLNVIDLVELFLLSSSRPEIEGFLTPGSSQHRYAVDVSAVSGGFFVASAANEALQNLPLSLALLSNGEVDKIAGDLMVLARVRFHPENSLSNNLLTVSTMDYLSSVNGTMVFYRPVLSISVGEDRLLVEYVTEVTLDTVKIPIPVRIVDENWHSLVIHWTKNGGDDAFYVWADCQLVYQGIAVQPNVFSSYEWAMSVGSPPLPTFIYIDEPPYFADRRPLSGLVEQLVVTRDRFFWQSDDQCRYQRETSAVKNSCPICTSSTLFANNRVTSVKSELMDNLGHSKRKLAEQFDTIKEQLDAALARIEFLERLQKEGEENSDFAGKCFEREGSRYFNVNDSWSVNNCSRQCICHLVSGKPRSICVPLRCSPQNVVDCPPFPFGGVVWDLANGCCPRCQRKPTDSNKGHRSCVRWHRASSVPHGANFFVKLANDSCAEKRCIDGRETVVRQGPRSTFCSGCLRSIPYETWQPSVGDKRLSSRQICCGVDSGPCKMRSCMLNASSVCDVPERASCEDTAEDILCNCRAGFIGDGSKCIDIDECQETLGTRFSANCTESEVCINTPGSFYCVAKTVPPPSDFASHIDLMSNLKKESASSFSASSARARHATLNKRAENFVQPECDDSTEISVRFSPRVAMCHCLPGFVRLRPTILLAFSPELLPNKLIFRQNISVAAQKCFDVDECQQMTSPCSSTHNCANIPGSYVCISNSYTAHEAHEIKFTANARRSTKNSASRCFGTKSISVISIIFLAIFVLF